MLEELGRQLLGAFYSSLSQPETGRPQLRDHLFTTATCQHRCVYVCVHMRVSIPPLDVHAHIRMTHTSNTMRACTHACTQTHKHRLVRWPPSISEINDSAGSMCAQPLVVCLCFPTSVKGPSEISNLDKVERWAALHMSVYYEYQKRPQCYDSPFVKQHRFRRHRVIVRIWQWHHWQTKQSNHLLITV